HKYIPREIMERPKMGFGIPIETWLSAELKDLVDEYLGEDSLKAHGLFNVQSVRNTVTDFFNGRKEKHLKVWYLLMFQMWYKRWM
ncbi:MAG: asparagine synthase-related protein, partial [Ferruginibacter sp.]